MQALFDTSIQSVTNRFSQPPQARSPSNKEIWTMTPWYICDE